MAQDEKARLHPSQNHRNDTHENSSSSFRWRRNRSSAHLDVATQAANAPAPTPAKAPSVKPAPSLARSSSKMSLFNLFSKPKVEKARGYSSEIGLAVPMQEQPKPKPPVSTPKSSLRVNPPPAVQQVQRSRSSQMLRPMSLKPTVRKPPENWDPPPLFQAYPQAVKYATVQACTFSPDVLLRSQSQRRQYDMLRERMDSHRDLSATLENTSETKKLEKTHRRLISNSVLNPPPPQLTNKIYVLVTAGYVLQYAGDGSFDRLPEKVLKLGQESAAFACDLIPGKHFVLQISQSASEDGTVSMGPKNSLLSRLRLQNASAKRAATSFLLVLDSAPEMESWMTAVRKEIDALGGMKTKEEPSTIAESPAEDTEEKKSQETPSFRYPSRREPKRVSKLAPVDSPLQSQYSDSPKIVASEWEGDRSVKTVSITDSSSLYSRQSTMRRSVEVSSIATTPMSHDGHQLEQLRERSRFSYMSTTTASGTGTRNTSRNSSPAPHSPLKEGFHHAETESLRSATSLRSFHMNPNSATANRRRSMQPLPITNEDNSLSAVPTSTTPQRHSIYGPTSPTIRRPDQEITHPTSSRSSIVATTPVPISRPANNVRFSSQFSSHTPVRSSIRSSSAPPTRNVISPPPRDPAPPPQGRPQSTVGGLPGATTTLASRSANRLSQTPKAFLRPFPIRPQNTDGSVVVPRRFSSLGPAPIPLGIVVKRSVTSPVQTSPAKDDQPTPTQPASVKPVQPSLSIDTSSVTTAPPATEITSSATSSKMPFELRTASSATISATRTTPTSSTSGLPFELRTSSARLSTPPKSNLPFELKTSTQTTPPQLRRPISVQVRSDPAPFVSSYRPVRAISSTPSFLPGKRASSASAVPSTLHSSPSVGVLRQQTQQQTVAKGVAPRKSMPAIGLPPPAPPPSMPLPPTPPGVARMRAVAAQ